MFATEGESLSVARHLVCVLLHHSSSKQIVALTVNRQQKYTFKYNYQ